MQKSCQNIDFQNRFEGCKYRAKVCLQVLKVLEVEPIAKSMPKCVGYC